MAIERINCVFVKKKNGNERLLIAFKDLLNSTIALQILPHIASYKEEKNWLIFFKSLGPEYGGLAGW